jgi:hypothetical protein
VETAKVPPELLKPPARGVMDMEVGETGYVTFLHLGVDSEGGCYIEARAKLSIPCGSMTVRITRREDGFHLAVRDDTELRPGGEPSRYRNEAWSPVASVIAERTR